MRSRDTRAWTGLSKARLAAALGLTLSLGLATQLAAEAVTVRLWNFNIHDKKYQQKMYKLFNERHPEIKIEYSSIANTIYDQTLEAAFIANEPPDLFLPGGKITFTYLLEKGMIKPLNECAPNAKELADWMAQYPPNLNKFVEGVSVFGGKVYIVDLHGESGAAGMPLFYNKTVFAKAGIAKPPATQSELRQSAAKITQAGQGQFFGISHGLRYGGVWHQDVSGSLAQAAGVQGAGGMEWGPSLVDGRFHHSDAEFTKATKVWIGMREDGSVFPGDTTMDDEQAKMAFATNKAAMFFSYDWMVGNALAYNPDCDFDLVLPPTPDDGIRRGYYNVALQGAYGYMVPSTTKNPRAVWEVIKFISSLEYQEGYVKGGYGISYLPAVNKPENFTFKQLYRFVEWANDPALRRIKPLAPTIKGWSQEKYVPGQYPGFMDVMTNVYLGKSGFDALKELDVKFDAAYDEGFKRAQADGIKISRADISFPDWDPSKDYVQKK